jgi:hypothetical protein
MDILLVDVLVYCNSLMFYSFYNIFSRFVLISHIN